MRLIRKYHPEDAPYIPNDGVNVYRIVALIKDGFEMYGCFYSMWADPTTGDRKVYVERIANSRHSSSNFSLHDFWQIENDKEFYALLDFLGTDECQVLQSVETSYIQDEKMPFNSKGQINLHRKLSKLPRSVYGVNANGSRIVGPDTPGVMVESPSISS